MGSFEDICEKGLKVPLLLSVTGHVDVPISSHDAIKGHLEYFFKEYKKNYSDTPIYLISALAEGGDRIAAEAAINADIPLLTVLPMPQSRYEWTFSSEGSVNDFRRLLSVSVNSDDPHIIKDMADPDDPDYEPSQYRALGEFLILNSHVILALWNGKHIDAKGGTSDVVRMAFHGIAHDAKGRDSNERSLNIIDRCLIYHITTPREKEISNKNVNGRYIKPEPIPKGSLGGIPEECISDELPKYYAKIFDRIQMMNVDMGHPYGRSKRIRYDKRDVIEGVEYDFLNRICFGPLPSDHQDDIERCDKILNITTAKDSAKKFTVADRLATKYQRKSLFNKRAYLSLITLSSILLMIYLTLYKEMVIIGSYAVVLALSILFYLYHVKIKDRESHNKFLEYRHLAEFMRVYFYSILSRRECSFSFMLYEYLREPTAWIRNTLKGWTSVLFADPSQLEEIPDIERIDITRRMWIDDQIVYHTNKRKRNKKGFTINISIEMVLSASAMLLSITIFLISFLSINGSRDINSIVITLNFLVALFNIFITVVITIKDFHIHGGTPEEIDLKIKMMLVAKERCDHVETKFRSGEYGEYEYVHYSREIFWQLSLQCIEECSDWAATHVTKYMKTAPKGPSSK